MTDVPEFENYTETSGVYDETRTPVGIEIIVGHLILNGIPLNQQTILDAGCGTGNFIATLVDHVHKLIGIELNSGMHEIACSKFEGVPNVQIDKGSITELPYDDATFDGIMSNHVIHHLDSGKGGKSAENYPHLRKFIQEAYRVLRPNGILIINTCSHRQQKDGYWWADLIPEAIQRVIKKFPPISVIEALYREIGFSEINRIVPYYSVLQGANYLDPKGPLKKEWRSGDSTWALATDSELSRAINRVKGMNRNKSISAYLKLREDLRKKTGQTTLICGKKI